MFLYDLPLHNSEEYVHSLLEKYSDKIYSVYFALSSSNFSDARVQSIEVEFNDTLKHLKMLPKHIKKYLTINGRYTPISDYATNRMQTVVEQLKILKQNDCLDGILWLDFYFLQRMEQIDREFCSTIEAVPSINTFIDSFEKMNSQLMYVHDLGFKPPSKIIIDRTLNRKLKHLAEFTEKVRKHYPEMKVETLVNEGCLYNCPFKVNHDIVISMVNEEIIPEKTKNYLARSQVNNDFDVGQLNERYGCLNYVQTHPSRFFEMPFIRPEDLDNYQDLVDVVKISGKVKSDQFVFRAIEAYENRKWEGNLLDLLDAAGPLDQYYYVVNDEIPDTFHKMLTTCDKNCLKCGYCGKLKDKVIYKI